ncbi:MAG: N-6 DNA methylase [Candidatus Onthoplasma sp.]
MANKEEILKIDEQVRMILDIANQLRGPFKEDEYQNVIIPMTICRRFECILAETKDKVVDAFQKGITNDIKLKNISKYSIYNTSEYTLKKLLDEPGKIKVNFKDYLDHFNSTAKEIFVQMKFYDTIDLMEKGKKLYPVIKRFANTDLSVENVNSMQMGYIMEEIIRTYSANASAGDHFTPREVIRCLTQLLLAEGCDDLYDSGKIVTLGDFACGTGGMLSEAYKMIKELNSDTLVELFGQDNNGWYEGIAEAEMIIKGQNPDNVKLVESTLTTDAFPDQKVRLILMNPPFGQSWSKKEVGDEQFEKIIAQNKSTGWFPAGLPAVSDCQMLFWQFALNKLDNEKGRAAIICNASPLFSSSSGESDIRKYIFENDWVDAIIQFCPELFYNTGISIYAIIFNKNKKKERKGKIQLINASSFCSRMSKGLGYKRNELSQKHIEKIVSLYSDFKENEYCKIFEKEDFYYREIIVNQPYQRNFAITKERIENVEFEQAFKKLYDEEKYDELDNTAVKTKSQLDLMKTYLEGKEKQRIILDTLSNNISEKIYKNRDEFTNFIKTLLPNFADNKTLIKGIVNALSDTDKTADIYKDKKGNIEPDSELKDTELVPYKENYNEYFEREVKPFVPNAWFELDDNKIKIGCVVNFNKYFHKYIAPESSDDIMNRLKDLDKKEKLLEENLYGAK